MKGIEISLRAFSCSRSHLVMLPDCQLADTTGRLRAPGITNSSHKVYFYVTLTEDTKHGIALRRSLHSIEMLLFLPRERKRESVLGPISIMYNFSRCDS